MKEATAKTPKNMSAWLRSVWRGRSGDSLKEAIEEVIEEHRQEASTLPTEEQKMLKSVLSFSDRAVKDIMTIRADIKAVEYNISLADLKTHLGQHRHTRIPVYNDTLDNVKGFIHIKDLVPLLAEGSPFNMALILRDMLFVPPSMTLLHLLRKMRVTGVHIAIVIDEYGGTDGLVTLEDIVEEIVGDIQDEHDDDENMPLAWNTQGRCDVDARVPVEKVTADLGLALSDEGVEADYDTLGGFLFHKLGRVPAKGEIVSHASGARFEILAADPRRIQRVRIFAPSMTAEKPQAEDKIPA